MRHFFLPIAVGGGLLLASCGKKAADVAQQQQAEPQLEITVITPQESLPSDKASQPGDAAPVLKPDPYAGLEIPSPPLPPKFFRMEKDQVVWGVVDKSLSDVVELLGYPSAKKPHQRKYYPDGWLYEWPIIVEQKGANGEAPILYPKNGIFFPKRDKPAADIYLNEYLTGAVK